MSHRADTPTRPPAARPGRAGAVDYRSPAATEPGAHDHSFRKLVTGYFGWILKNVVGWLLIIAAPILGIALPGPGGIPVFLIGFALVTFPGKRKLTTRFMRGRRLPIESPLFTGLVTFVSVLVTAAVMILGWRYYEWIAAKLPLRDWRIEGASKVVAVSLVALPTTMLVGFVGLRVLNYCLGWVPRLRRLVRPMLRKFGVRLLPTRRRRIGGQTELVQDEILSFDDSQRQRLVRVWHVAGPWLTRLLTTTLTVGIIYFLVAPVVREWPEVEARIGRLNLGRIGVAVGLFAAGFVLFRVVAWQAILRGFGQPVPLRAAARIWSLSHFARYIPGRAHHVARMELARRYGPSATQANVAHRLENTLTLFAALAIGASAFWMVAYARLPHGLRPALVAVAVASPLALVLTVPSVFYKLLPPQTGLWRRDPGRPTSGPTQLRGAWLLGVLLWLAAWGWCGRGWRCGCWSARRCSRAVGRGWWWGRGAWAGRSGHLAPWSPGGIGGAGNRLRGGAERAAAAKALRDNFAATTPPVSLDFL